MEPGHFAVLSWIPKVSSNHFPDTLTIYDGGNIQGFLMKEATGKTTWIVFQVEYRLLQQDGIVTEGRVILPESSAPLHYHSIDTYPMLFQSQGKFQKLLTLPQAQVLLHLSEEPLFSPPSSLPSSLPSSPQPPVLHQQRPQPSLLRPKGRDGPGQHAPRKSDSSRPTGEQLSSQSKSTSSPKSTAKSSSNPNRRAQPLSPAPVIQAAPPLQPLPEHHTGHESSESLPWTSLAQQSLYSRPPPELEGEHVEQA